VQKTVVFGILLACGFAAAHAVTAEESQKYADRYNTLLKYDLMATADVMAKFGKSLRVATWLNECKLEELGDAIAPSKSQIGDVVMQYLAKQADGRPLFWEVLAGVNSSVDFYRIGFKDSAAPLQALNGQFCQDVAKQANDILRERKGEK
jgi:hypothetical protein